MALRSPLARSLALLLALGLVAAGCGGDDDGGDTASPEENGAEGEPSGDDGEPVRGGTLVYGIEADTANAWPGYRASYATAGYMVIQSVSDPLFLPNEEGVAVPHLVETAEPNADYTEWTLTLRDGITFHDGTPFDAAAVKYNMETCMGSGLAAPTYANIGSVTAEGQVVTVTTATMPWVSLPAYFGSLHGCSYMMSPEWLKTLPDDPHRTEGNRVYDPAIAALPANGDPSKPVGLGAFVLESYTPGNGNSFKATRNEDYWRGPNGITGEELPYLDAIEYVVAVDIDSRSNALRSGQFDIIHTANTDEIVAFQEDDEFETIVSSEYGETNYIMLNVAEGTNPVTGAAMDPTGSNADSPLLQVACRRALAHAIDEDRLNEERGGGISPPANGPFPEGSIGWLEDTGYPTYDLDAAEAEMETCLEETGTDGIEFSFNTTNDPFNVETNTLIISMWQEAFGDRVSATISPIEQGQYIGLALTGTFDLFAWRNHGGFDPDMQRRWWSSATASPIGSLALNFGRFRDPVIDESLDVIRTNPDPDARREAAEDINRAFGENVYNLWLSWTLWGVMSPDYVHDVEANPLPAGGNGLGFAMGGRHQIPQIWCTDGACE
jgi:peptide/nickel transport system substrate-binding protein